MQIILSCRVAFPLVNFEDLILSFQKSSRGEERKANFPIEKPGKVEPDAEVSGTVSPRSFDVGTVGGDSLRPVRQKAGLTGGEHCHSRDWDIYFQRGQGRHDVVLACIYSSADVSSAQLKIHFQQIRALWIQTFCIRCGQPGRYRWGHDSCLFAVYPLSR